MQVKADQSQQSEPNMADYKFYKTLLHPDKSDVKGEHFFHVFAKKKWSKLVGKEDADLYLSRTLYPVLLTGLEDLAAQIEKMQSETDPRVRCRFNACAYLAEYLMRNNPKYNPEKTKDLIKLYAQFAKKEKIERVLQNRKALLRSLFTRASGSNFAAQIEAFVAALDKDLGLTIKISKAVDVESILAAKEVTGFEEFWTRWIEAMKEQKAVDGEELEKALEAKYPTSKK